METPAARTWRTRFTPTCALVLQTLAIVSLLTDAVVLSRVRAALAAGHQVTAIHACLAEGGAARQVVLDVAACGEVCGRKATTEEHRLQLHQIAPFKVCPAVRERVTAKAHETNKKQHQAIKR